MKPTEENGLRAIQICSQLRRSTAAEPDERSAPRGTSSRSKIQACNTWTPALHPWRRNYRSDKFLTFNIKPVCHAIKYGPSHAKLGVDLFSFHQNE